METETLVNLFLDSNQHFDYENAPFLLLKLAEIINSTALTGIEKKSIVLNAAKQIVEKSKLSDESKVALALFITTYGANVIDSIVTAAKSRSFRKIKTLCRPKK